MKNFVTYSVTKIKHSLIIKEIKKPYFFYQNNHYSNVRYNIKKILKIYVNTNTYSNSEPSQ
ncbi:MAG: hypothetical protein BWY70_01126 [Bacteroidetes bacterium ADurb.Bin408]|nr:MAG: hypothetical protein BWY70_01126 [Bacteroidetes bacterium ADurb.Bin408]